jgi:hypothetical protein
MLFNRDSTIQKCFRRFCTACKSENSVPYQPFGRPCHTIWTPIYPECQPSGRRFIPSGRRELSVQTFPCVEKFRTALAYIRPNISATRPDDSHCLTSFRISFHNTVIGRSLQPSELRGFPSGRAHP